MGKTVAGTDVPTIGDLKSKAGRGQLGKVASAAFVATAIGTPIVMAGVGIGSYLYRKVRQTTGGMTEAFRGLA